MLRNQTKHPIPTGLAAVVFGRRQPGGLSGGLTATVTVRRGGVERTYRVSPRRYMRLADTFNVHRGLRGSDLTASRFRFDLTSTAGLQESRRWVARQLTNGQLRPWWQPA